MFRSQFRVRDVRLLVESQCHVCHTTRPRNPDLILDSNLNATSFKWWLLTRNTYAWFTIESVIFFSNDLQSILISRFNIHDIGGAASWSASLRYSTAELSEYCLYQLHSQYVIRKYFSIMYYIFQLWQRRQRSYGVLSAKVDRCNTPCV